MKIIIGSIPIRGSTSHILYVAFLLRGIMSHKFLTDDKLAIYNSIIDNDDLIPEAMKKNPIIREVCLAGLYLVEELVILGCPLQLATRIQFTAGKLSFGREPWEVHQSFIDGYQKGELSFEVDERHLN
jgi:hypothetical protein